MIGKNIRKLRENIGISQEELATAVGIARPIISQIENGSRKVSADELPAFSRALNASADQLLGTTPLPEVSIAAEPHAGYQAHAAQETMRISVPQKHQTKFRQVLLYILNNVGAKPNIGETVLYKLLYFIDFDFYEKYEEQLIGATYIKNHYGPTPAEFAKLVELMAKKGEIEKVKSGYFNFPQTKYLPRKTPDLSALSAREIKVIDQVLARLSDMNAKQISEYSHKDVPWLTTEEGHKIEYESVFYRTPEYSARDYGTDI
jgi:transcriptional regulator with XRE-family HTH domain